MPSNTPPNDPFIYANMLNNFVANRNPVQILIGDVTRMVKVLANLQNNRKMAQARIEQLQNQVALVESHIASVNPQTTGNRINRLR